MRIRVCRYKNAGVAGYAEALVVLKNENRPGRGGFHFLRQFIVFTDMKIVYKRNLKKSGTIDSVFVSQPCRKWKSLFDVKMFNKIC